MFFHNFKYSLKVLLRNKILIFWTLAFPLLLGTLFYMAFSDIEKNETFQAIDIAVIDHKSFQENIGWKKTLEILSDEESDDQIFHTVYVNLEEAENLLYDKKITGYVNIEEQQVSITVNSSGMNETILKYVIDEIKNNQQIIEDVMTHKMKEYLENPHRMEHIDQLYSDVSKMMRQQEVKLHDISNSNLSYTMVEYYTLIAMSCLYGGMLSMFAINYTLANMGSIGKRSSITPVKKSEMILGSLAASYVIQLLGILLLFVYTVFVLNVDYGNHLALVILLACIGSLAGLSIGIAVATLVKSNENTKTGILIAVTMFGCFLSGMMGITMKYIIDKNIPILNQLNPANMITDGLYALYYYDTLQRYTFNLICLLIFSCLMIFISYRELRRQTYDSI